MSTFDLVPTEMPVLVAVDRRCLEVGDTLTVRHRGAGEVALRPAGAPSEASLLPQLTAGNGRQGHTFPTDDLAPGAYEAVLVDADVVRMLLDDHFRGGRGLATVPRREPSSVARR